MSLATESASKPRAGKLRPLALLLPYVARYRGRVLAALVALLVASGATLLVPIAVRRMIDFGFAAERIALINQYFGLLLLVCAVLAMASAGRYYLVTTLGERVVADLRSDVFEHLTNLSSEFFDRSQSGELLSRLTADTTQLKSAVGSAASVALRNIVLFVGAATMMVVTSPRLSFFVLLTIPVIVIPLVAFGRMVRRRSRGAQDTLADASAYAAELIGANRILQAFTNEPLATSRFSSAVENAYRAAIESTVARAALTAIVIFLATSSVVAILWVGAQDVIAGDMTPGRLGQFVLFAVFAASGLGQLSEVWGEISQGAGSAERLLEILAVTPAIKTPAQAIAMPQPMRGEIQFANVSFAYPARPDVSALREVSFRVSPGEKVALVGPSGAGKSTIFHLILRFYDPVSGKVSLDGVRLADADPREVRRHIALVPQESVVFATSVRENIRFGRTEASDAEIERAAEQANASEFIARLPQGFDTPVGERGVTLSGGQRQRLAIARAILRNAPLLLLDEATSSLDAESERLVQSALSHLMEKRTTLVIAHRLATVLSCDRILVLDQGRVVEEGTHASLSGGSGLYARLAKLQFHG